MNVNVEANTYDVIVEPSTGGVYAIATGYAFRKSAANISYFFIKDFIGPNALEEVIFENFAVSIPDAIEEATSELGNNLVINYPNPFREYTNIQYSLNSDSHVKITVYSTSGSIVANLVNENKVAGQHTVEFRTEGLKGGVYIYQVET